MFNKIKELYFELGLIKSILWLAVLVIVVVGLTITLAFAVLFLMQKYDDRYTNSEEGKLEMKIMNEMNEQKENYGG